MDERDEAQERERRRIWTVAVRVVDGALRARVIGQLHASGETELAAEAGWNAADVSVTDDAARNAKAVTFRGTTATFDL